MMDLNLTNDSQNQQPANQHIHRYDNLQLNILHTINAYTS